jgi:hypothetical protein
MSDKQKETKGNNRILHDTNRKKTEKTEKKTHCMVHPNRYGLQ